MDLLSQQIFGASESRFWLLTGIFAIAWVAGFIMPGAPGGLGVREAILVAILSSFYDSQIVVGIAVSLRVVTILGDGVAFIVGFVAGRKLLGIPSQSTPCN